MDNDDKKKNRKKIIKRFFRIAVIIIVAWLAVNICLTLLFTQKIPHRYASAQEGKELMLSNTEYYSGFTQNDIEFRMKKSGEIELTPEGIKEAREICEKHSTLSDFLRTVAKVDEKTAKEDARWIGHYLSPSTYEGIKRYIQSLQTKGVIRNELE